MAAKASAITEYDIPVVFHIIYSASNPTFNIPDSVLINQIAILNIAYNKENTDTSNARSFFQPLIGNAHVHFHLATVDPQGAVSTGITRTISTHACFGDASYSIDSLERIKHTAQGGIDAWPTNHYLNIWVANLSDASGNLGILGYGIPPLDPLPNNWDAADSGALAIYGDGVVLQTHVVGSNSTLNGALQGIYTKGRAAVHEVGHYLGLQHVFGGNGSTGGSCGSVDNDGIDDTPEQSIASFDNNSTTSCPPSDKNSCGEGTTGDLPDMWEDYMDYARDACQVMFTNGQVAVMRGVLANQRLPLTEPLAIGTVMATPEISIYPNPTSSYIVIVSTHKIDYAIVTDMVGKCVKRIDNVSSGQRCNLEDLPTGNYLLSLQSENFRVVKQLVVIK